MARRKASTSRPREEEEVPRREVRTKHRHDPGTTSRTPVIPDLNSLFRNEVRAKMFREKFSNREVMAYKHVDFPDLIRMHDTQDIDVANYIAVQGWQDFTQVNKPVYRTLLKVLMSNLDESSMMSWIGGTPVDLSMDAWCRTFQLPPVSVEDESFIMSMEKEELFFRLTGVRNLGVQPFIRINQLHQEANVRLTAQVVMNVLVPKKGSKEQIKVEEGRLLYAMIYGKQINLARMIVERLKAALGRKSVPICYGMHLTVLMVQSGVDVLSAGDKEERFSSVIDHHTLKRLGYRRDVATWTYVGRGRVNLDQPAVAPSEHDTEAEEDLEGTAQAESTAPSQPPPSRFTSSHHALHTEIAHLRNFMLEQFQFLQATLMSKLDSIETRVQVCESHILGHQSRASPPPPPPSDPKGKAPMVSPRTSPLHSPTGSPIPSPEFHIPLQTDPVLVPSHSSHSSHSSSETDSTKSTSQHFEFSARTPPVTPKAPTPTHSQDSEATPSDPTRFIVTPPPSPPPPAQPIAPTSSTRSKQGASKNPSFTPSPPSPTQPPQPPPTSQTTPIPYVRRKLAVSRPGTSTTPPPPPQP